MSHLNAKTAAHPTTMLVRDNTGRDAVRPLACKYAPGETICCRCRKPDKAPGAPSAEVRAACTQVLACRAAWELHLQIVDLAVPITVSFQRAGTLLPMGWKEPTKTAFCLKLDNAFTEANWMHTKVGGSNPRHVQLQLP